MDALLTPRTRSDLTAAVSAVILLASGEDRADWPTERLQAALTRDGDRPVIDHLSGIAVGAIRGAADRGGTSPRSVADFCYRQVTLDSLPFEPAAWPRARTLCLHRINGKPLRIRGGPIEAVDLAGGLILLHVLAVLRYIKAETAARRPIPPSSRF